jgi:hypothetical protein
MNKKFLLYIAMITFLEYSIAADDWKKNLLETGLVTGILGIFAFGVYQFSEHFLPRAPSREELEKKKKAEENNLKIEKLEAEKKVLEDQLKHFNNLEGLKSEELVKEVPLSEKLHPEKKAEDEQSHFLIEKKNDQTYQLNQLFQMRQGQHNWKSWVQVKNISNLLIDKGSLLIKNRINKINEQIDYGEQNWEIHNTFNV